MKHSDIEILMRGAAPVIRSYVEKAIAPLVAEIAELKARPIPKDVPGFSTGQINHDGCLILTLTDGKSQELGVVVGKDGVNGAVGKDGAPGLNGAPGEPGKEGPQGRDGRDGLPGVPGARGLDGKDGKDGLGFEDMSADFDGERTVTLRFSRGDVVKEFSFAVPIPIDCGIYREGEVYAKGAGVTYGGSFWICQRDAPEGKPDAGNGSWRLVTKKGRDGKDGQPGKQGDPGPKGKDGRDLTQLGPDGSKWD